MRASANVMRVAALCAVVIALSIGFAFGRLSGNGTVAGAPAGTPAVDATAAHDAELAELRRLQTQVAQTSAPAVCTVPATNTPMPSPTSTPSPMPTLTPTLVPPAAAGTPKSYAGDWTVNVVDVTFLQKFVNTTPEGVFLKVTFAITNNTANPRAFPYDQLTVRDEKGRVFILSLKASLNNEAGLYTPFAPNLPSTGFAIFDVATDAAGPFVLESKVDPTFRVQIAMQTRG
jgi:hypothetical protein